MKLSAQVYIDSSGDVNNPTYKRLDFFDFESIQLTSTIQDIRDIGAVFTDYSREFVVPASENNNKILQHFYNINLQDGFDSRIKRRGYISLNGVMFREGFIRLSESKVKNNKVYSYTLIFFGSLVQLSDVIGEDKLSDLQGLSQFTHEYTRQNVYDGFVEGLAPSGGSMVKSSDRDVIYPAISAKNLWTYDTTSPYVGDTDYRQGKSINLRRDSARINSNGIIYTDLKPAIKVMRIIEAIEETYSSITFSRDFFGTDVFDDLYLLLHALKGELTEENDRGNLVRFYLTGANEELGAPDTGTDVRPLTTITQNEIEDTYDLNFTLTPANLTSLYSVRLYNGSELLRELIDVAGVQTFTRTLRSVEEKTWDNLFLEFESVGTISFTGGNLQVQMVESTSAGSGSGIYSNSADVSTLQGVVIERHLPDIGVLDFLKGLFKMFNLTAELVDGTIQVKTLYQFYNDGNSIDISDQLDTSEYTAKRSQLFNDVSFKFIEPKTFGMINQNEVNNDEFGDLDWQSTPTGRLESLIFDGKKYEIKLPFEKLFFPVMSIEPEGTSLLEDFGSGWLVDKDQNPTITKPVLFFNNVQNVDTSKYEIEFREVGLIETYNRPSNTRSGKLVTLNFGTETDEFLRESNENGLFKVFYQQYIESLYNKSSRIMTHKAKLRLSTLLEYKMNDKIIVNGNSFRINSIDTNLTTGMCDLELITDFEDTWEYSLDADVTPPTIPTGFAQTLSGTVHTFTWNASTDTESGVKDYDFLIDGVVDTTTTGLSATWDNSGNFSSYDFTVRARDNAGNVSAQTSAITLAPNLDTTNPTAPTTVGEITPRPPSIVNFFWSGATDNVGVVGYNLYIDGVFEAFTSSTGYALDISGYSAGTYTLTVESLDAQGNASDPDATFNFTV